jgi:putative ABC transport system permease protein
MRPPRHARLVKAAVAGYRRLLWLFPAPFRNRFGAELIDAFATSTTDSARERGIYGLLLAVGGACLDVVRHSAGERWATWRGAASGLPIRARASSSIGLLSDHPYSPPRAAYVAALMQDARFAVRTLAKTPTFTAAAVLTIALGIGAATSIFTVVDRIVLRPLPFPNSERVVMLCETSPQVEHYCVASPANVADWTRSVPALDTAGVAREEPFIGEASGTSFGVPGGIVSPGFFETLGIRPALGRLIEGSDLNPARNQVIVISDAFWRERFGGRPDVVGRDLQLDNRAFRVIGVLPRGAYIPTYDAVQAWKPLSASVDDTTDRKWRGFLAVGRLARGATIQTLEGQIQVARAQLAAAYPAANAGWGVRVASLRHEVIGDVSSTLWMFLGAVGFVLVIACSNVASLLLVHGSGRASEFAVRASLGAGPARLIRQVLTESFVLAAAGGVSGWLLAMLATKLLVGLAPADIPRLDEVSADGRVAWFTCALTTGAALVFGLAPALDAARRRLVDTLKATRVTDRRGLRSALVVAELTLSIVLLIGAGVFTRAFGRLLSWDPGFNRSGVMVSWVLAPTSAQTTLNAVATLEQVREQVASIPGVRAVGLGSAGPLFGGVESGALSIDSARPASPEQAPVVHWFDADPHYFGALGRRIVRGRGLEVLDVDGAPDVAVINESFARQFFSPSEPLGRRVTVEDHAATIVGVVADVRPTRPDRATPPEIFWPIRQFPRGAAYLVMRVTPEAGSIESVMKARIAEANPHVQVTRLVTLEQMFGKTLVSPRFNMMLILTFAVVAIVLAAIGVYGVVAYSVASRRREIGVRVALGATSVRVVRDLIGGVMLMACISLAIGVGMAMVLGHAVQGMFYGVSVTDGLGLTVSISVFLAAVLAAGYFPARRATSIDPVVALRSD